MDAPEPSPHAVALPADSEPALFIAGLRATDLQDGIGLLRTLDIYPRTSFVLFLADASSPGIDLTALIAPHSPMPVVTAEEGMRLLPNRIHLAPPHGALEIHDRVLHIATGRPQPADGGYDEFLQALAKSAGPRAMAFVTAGSENAPGPRAIRAAGGRIVSGGGAKGGLVNGRLAPADTHPPGETSPPGGLDDSSRQARLVALEEQNEALWLEIQEIRHAFAMEQQRLEQAQAIHEGLSADAGELTNQIRTLELTAAELLKEAQQSQEVARELKDIMACSGVAALLLDANLNIRFFTPSGRLPFRIIASDIGRPLSDIAPLVADPAMQDEILLVLATGEPASRELEGSNDSWLMRRIHPYFEQAEPAGVVITYADISEIKAAIARAQTMRGMAADIIRSHHQPLILLDENLHVIFANDPFREAFGHDGDEVGLRILLGAALRAAPQLSTFLTGRDPFAERIEDCVIQVSLPAFGARTLRLAATRIPPRRTLLAVDDITERVLLTAGLENAKAAAERASRDKSRLLAAASQELRQPLQSFEAFYRAQFEWENDAGVPRHMKRLGAAIKEISGVLDALQDGAQLDMGTLEVTTSAFPVSTVLAGLDADFGASARQQGIRWRIVGSGRTIVSDPRILQRALRHVVSVLLRYTPVTRILIGCRPRGNQLSIEIRTQGLQFPLPALRAGFEARQDGLVRAEGSEGLRLGLDVARRLSEFLGHLIRIDTRSASQSAFVMDVPALNRSAPSLPTRHVRDGMRHVLLIEEDGELAASLRRLLERGSYSAMIATDAAHALGLALEYPPALIITEYILPGSMTGLDLVRRIAGTRDPPPAAILLTDEVGTATLREIVAAGFDHAPRTISAQDLLERVQSLLPHSAGTDATPAATRSLRRIFVLDDNAERRLGLRDWLASLGWIAEEFSSNEAFLEADTPERRGCVLADWSTAETSGGALLPALRPLVHRLPVVVVADHGDIRLAVAAISAGAIDFIKRPIQPDTLMRALEKATAQVAESEQQQATGAEQSARLASLTQRQKEILERIIAGVPNKIIAADLNLSQRTVENHRATLMAKLGARSLPELIRIAMGAR